MLFWQRKSTHKRFVLWVKLAAISAVFHIVCLVWFFFIFKDRSSRLSLVVTPDLFNREIVFTIATQPKVTPKTSPVKKAASKKQTSQKKVIKQTTLASQKTKPKAIQKKAPVKKVAPKPVVKKAVSKPAVKKEVAQPKVEPKTSIPQKADPLAQASHHELEVHKIGVHERGLLEEFKALHEDIVSKWAPPPGIAPNCSCQVTMLIDWKGALRDLKMQESSGVLMYDTAAQKALTQIEMPKWTWGKEITITFNQ